MKPLHIFIILFCSVASTICRFDYDLVIIGAGASGLIAVQTALKYNNRIAIIERDRIEKSRVWAGDIPLKTLIKISEVADLISKAHLFGLTTQDITFSADNIFSYIHKVVEKTAALYSTASLQDSGVDVIIGEASFIDEHTITVSNKLITAQNFIIATGGKPYIPLIKGIDTIDYITTDSFFQLKKLPTSIMIAGQGPVSIELATALNRLGVKVTLIIKHGLILPNYDFELVEIQYKLMKQEGIKVKCNMRIKHVTSQDGYITATCKDNLGQEHIFKAESFLVALGQVGNTDMLNIKQLGIKEHYNGIIVNNKMQTEVPHIYACGDVVGETYTLSRVAYYQAKLAAHNALHLFWQSPKTAHYANVSSLVQASLPLGAIGLTEQDARKKYGHKLCIYRYNYQTLVRAHIEGTTEGIAKFICDQSGCLLGVHVLGAAAGQIIDSVHIGTPFGKQFEHYLTELRTSPNYIDLVWEAAKKCKAETSNEFFLWSFIKQALSLFAF